MVWIRIENTGGSIPDVGPMPSMPFAVTYSGEQPGSAAGFAVIPP
jgi:hypothetical protein